MAGKLSEKREGRNWRPSRRKSRALLLGGSLLVVVAVALVATHLPGRSRPSAAASAASDGPALAKVTRGTLTSQQQVSGTVGYKGSYNVENQLTGIYTSLSTVGQVISQGQPLYRVGTGSGGSKAALLSAQAQLAADRASLNSTTAQIQAQQQRVKADQARVQNDQEAIQGLDARAPFSGVVSAVDVTSGDTVGQGSKLFEVVNPSDLTVVANFSSVNLQQVSVGEGAEVTVAGIGTIQATVKSVAVASSGGGLFPVTLDLESPPAGLRGGMSATVSIPTAYTHAEGTVEYADAQTVSAQTSGTVQDVSATVGQGVQAGDTLVTLENQNLATQLSSDQATLAADQAQLKPTADQVSSLKARITSDQQAVYDAEKALSQGDVPGVLLYGSTPAYRTLQQGESGPDVQELNRDLVALGDATRSQLNPSSSDFNAATAEAVRRLQANVGAPQTGQLALGQVVFLPTALRVTSVSPSVGATAQAGHAIISGTSNTAEVVAQIDASLQSDVKAGDSVAITLPDQSVVGGKVTDVKEAPSSGNSSSSTAVEVDIAPSKPEALNMLNGATVNVAVTTASAQDVLAVPVTALLSRPDGSYAVEVVGKAGKRRFVPVTLGLFDDARGLVQISGSGLTPGDEVVVAGS